MALVSISIIISPVATPAAKLSNKTVGTHHPSGLKRSSPWSTRGRGIFLPAGLLSERRINELGTYLGTLFVTWTLTPGGFKASKTSG